MFGGDRDAQIIDAKQCGALIFQFPFVLIELVIFLWWRM